MLAKRASYEWSCRVVLCSARSREVGAVPGHPVVLPCTVLVQLRCRRATRQEARKTHQEAGRTTYATPIRFEGDVAGRSQARYRSTVALRCCSSWWRVVLLATQRHAVTQRHAATRSDEMTQEVMPWRSKT